jgi:nucleoside-diphosphate-sugar epimerase
VRRAVAGCDAVVHAAAVFSFDSRAYGSTTRTNEKAADLVLRAAVENGCDPVIHVSSTVALVHRDSTVTENSLPSDAKGVYLRSKVAGELIARGLQAQAAPVVIVYPGAVLGPHDPYLSDNVRRFADVVRGRYPMWPSGGLYVVDVRDVARVHAAVMAPGGGPRRFIVPGTHVTGATMFDTLRTVTGRSLRHAVLPARMLLPLAWTMSALQRVVPVHIPAEYEGTLIMSYNTSYDDSRARDELRVEPRPLAETYQDTVRWLHRAGHISARQAGLVAAVHSS